MRNRPIFYGWIMLPVSMAGLICTAPGQTFGFSAFNPLFEKDLGLSTSQVSGAYMVGTFLASLAMTWVGHMIDVHGPRKVMGVVVALFAATCVYMSFVSGLITLFVGFLLMRMLGQGALGLVSGHVVQLWFTRKLGFATGLRNGGMAVAVMVLPLAFAALADAVHWRIAYVLFAIAIVGIMGPLLIFVFVDRPSHIGEHPDGDAIGELDDDPHYTDLDSREGLIQPDGDVEPAQQMGVPQHEARQHEARQHEVRSAPPAPAADAPPDDVPNITLPQALRTRTFWIMTVLGACWSMMGTAAHFHMFKLCTVNGFGDWVPSQFFLAQGVTMIVAQMVAGWLADRVPLPLLLSASALGLSATMGLVGWMPATWAVPTAGVLLGIAQSLLIAAAVTLWVRYYGRIHLGKIQGTQATTMVAASSVGPFAAGLSFDYLGGFHVGFYAFAAIVLPMVLITLAVNKPRIEPTSA